MTPPSRWFDHLPIRRKVFWASVLVGVVAALTTTVPLFLAFRAQARERFATETDRLARLLAENVVASLDFGDPTSAREILSSIAVDEGIAAAILFDDQGARFASYEREGIRLPDELRETTGYRDPFYIANVPVADQFRSYGRVALVSSIAPLEQRIRQGVWTSAALFGSTVLVALLVARAFERVVTRPLRLLRQSMAKFGQHPYWEPELSFQSQDEVGELGRTFNEMAVTLQHQRTELAQSNAELEQRVARRTATITRQASLLDAFRRHAPVALAMLDYNLNYLARSRRWADELGLQADVQPGEHIVNSLPGYAEKWHPVLRQALKGKDVYGYQEELPTLTEPSKRINWAVTPWYDENGAVGGAMMALEDVTEQVRMQEELGQSQQRLQFHVENTPLAVVEFAVDGTITQWNAKAAEVFGWDSSEILGSKFERIVSPADHSAAAENFDALLHGRGGTFTSQRNQRKDGQVIDCEWYNTQLRDAQGRVSGVASLAVDVTLRKRTESQLRAERDRAEAANRAKSQFLAIMNHELRTPLNTIIGPLDLLEAEVTTDVGRELVTMMRNSAVHLLNLISNILDLTRIESGQMEPSLRQVDLHRNLQQRLTSLEHLAQSKGLQFNLELTGEVPKHVILDENLLMQALYNLIGNAIKFTEAGDVSLQVSREHDSSGEDWLCFAVADTGIGIPEDRQRLIFEPFSQADMSLNRRYEGSGLGLAITSEIARLLGGKLTVSSREGRGSRFELRLPCNVDNGKRARSNTPPFVRIEPLGIPPHQRVLFVEDEEKNLRVAQIMMNRLGVVCDYARNGREAVELFENQPYRLVLMDIRMPEMGGQTAAKRIRELPGGQVAIIIAQTAFATKEHRQSLLSHGFDAFLSKPLTIEDLRNTLLRYRSFLAGEV
ncbi:MAG: ATP-binding protein [Opitutales bacterium]